MEAGAARGRGKSGMQQPDTHHIAVLRRRKRRRKRQQVSTVTSGLLPSREACATDRPLLPVVSFSIPTADSQSRILSLGFFVCK